MKSDQGAAQSTPELLPVVQADRKASWTIWRWLYCDDPADWAIAEQHHMEGDNDEHFIVQDFARHRIEHSTPDRNAVLEEAAKVVLSPPFSVGQHGAWGIAEAIRALMTTTPEPKP